MNNVELEAILFNSLEDLKLDQQEKDNIKELTAAIRSDQLGFLRNKAFDLARAYVEEGGAEAMTVINWLEKVVKVIQAPVEQTPYQASACFSPGTECRNKIISLMKGARKEVDICLFTISDNRITESIMAAHKRGVAVTVISDNDKANDRGSDVDQLSNYGVRVLLDNSPYHMHHKGTSINCLCPLRDLKHVAARREQQNGYSIFQVHNAADACFRPRPTGLNTRPRLSVALS